MGAKENVSQTNTGKRVIFYFLFISAWRKTNMKSRPVVCIVSHIAHGFHFSKQVQLQDIFSIFNPAHGVLCLTALTLKPAKRG